MRCSYLVPIFSAFCFIRFLRAESISREKRPKVSGLDFDNDDPYQRARFSRSEPYHNFPIVMPYYELDKPAIPKPNWGSCLLYIESISIVVFGKQKKYPSAVVATIHSAGGKNRFTFNENDVDCKTTSDDIDKMGGVQRFNISLKIQNPAVAGEGVTTFFTVGGDLNISLEFKLNRIGEWKLSKLTINKMDIKKGNVDFLEKDISLFNKELNGSQSPLISGFYGYGFACSSTPALITRLEDNGYAVGISFDNIQYQPFDAIKPDDKDPGIKTVRFSPNVNDCVGTFSVGSWMGIIVVLILSSVLFFGYFMLSSVQTMDRYDDPKQKQLIIGSKD